eukprot:CAMPEP_0114149948 /NCGR_PEP_ID=MMETSP0043_2-20121206/22439_1 /TAXON_ID=464988 /ORGANISM="Hemiselmis andersenii, Strain CCMP644" /LENGTH=93 /DNA_ID=CAMNT_0001244641 /DNA_START=119 /DNA_END=400 /DNA_ORIENTATION=+
MRNALSGCTCSASGGRSEAAVQGDSMCVRVCRYKKYFFEGQVCIGCFRDSFEIKNWSKLSEEDKRMATKDAQDRRGEWERRAEDDKGKVEDVS